MGIFVGSCCKSVRKQWVRMGYARFVQNLGSIRVLGSKMGS